MIIEGVIEKKEQNEGTSQSGKPYVRWVFHIDGKKYSTFNEDIAKEFKVGEYVEVELKKVGQYFNMISMKRKDIPEENDPQEDLNSSQEDIVSLLRKILAELKEINKRANGNSTDKTG